MVVDLTFFSCTLGWPNGSNSVGMNLKRLSSPLMLIREEEEGNWQWGGVRWQNELRESLYGKRLLDF